MRVRDPSLPKEWPVPFTAPGWDATIWLKILSVAFPSWEVSVGGLNLSSTPSVTASPDMVMLSEK